MIQSSFRDGRNSTKEPLRLNVYDGNCEVAINGQMMNMRRRSREWQVDSRSHRKKSGKTIGPHQCSV
ncbi:hypothetical protein AAZX31_09G186500 [Glycine max]|nr:hypothetical protein GYH30_025665 [Glycine max]KRH39681.2 hypothetical protein GLYMA_09G204350v4 [Glycine max]